MTPTADSWPRESFLMRRFIGSWKSSMSRSASSWSQFGKNRRAVAERVLGLGVVGVLLAFADEAHALQHLGVLVRVLPEDPHVAARGEVLRGQDRHHRGLAGAVAAEEAVDGVLLDREAHPVDGERVAVALGEVRHLDHGGHRAVPSVAWTRPARGGAVADQSAEVFGAEPELAGFGQEGLDEAVGERGAALLEQSSRAPGATNMPMPRRL